MLKLLVMTAALSLPLAVVSQPQEVASGFIAVTVDSPSVVNAGENFSVTASLVNTSSESVLASVHWVLRPGAVLGSHASSYRIFSHPLREATPHLQIVLEPGIPRLIPLREFFYESDELFSGEFVVQESKIMIFIRSIQTAETILDPIFIEVKHEGPEAPAKAHDVPERLPLERRAIGNESDGAWVAYDPNTGYEWLPLSRTHKQPLLSVMKNLVAGAEFEGFRIANLNEVQTLFLNAIYASGIYYPDYALFAADEYQDGDLAVKKQLLPVARKLHEQLGITHAIRLPEHEFDSASGVLIGTNDVPDAVLEASVSVQGQSERGDFYLGPVSEYQVGSSNTYSGVWLLRESDK